MKKAFLLSCIGIFLFFSCETVVELEVPEKEPGLVANCFFNPDSVFSVNISKSQYVLDNAPLKDINNAIVSLYSESVFLEDLGFISEGKYRSSSIYPQIGVKYQISVKAKGFTTVEADDFVPAPTQIISVDTGSFFMSDQKYFELKVGFLDRTSDKNYYQLQLYSKVYFPNFDSLGNFFWDTTTSFLPLNFESNDLIFDDHKWFGNSGAVFSDALFSSKGEYYLSIYTYAYNNELSMLGKDYAFDEVKVVLKSISEAYYKYVVSYQKFRESNGNPFSEPVQVYNNISNGYGIFAGYSGNQYSFKLN